MFIPLVPFSDEWRHGHYRAVPSIENGTALRAAADEQLERAGRDLDVGNADTIKGVALGSDDNIIETTAGADNAAAEIKTDRLGKIVTDAGTAHLTDTITGRPVCNCDPIARVGISIAKE